MKVHKNMYDLIIVGGGPAGLTAAIYAARAKERVLVIEKNEFGGQIALTAKVSNYPGIPECSGQELADAMKEQAKVFGAELIYGDILAMEINTDIKSIETSKGKYQALSVILAPGAIPRSAGFQGEKEFKGKGVCYCATCDGPLFAGCELFVVGGGLAAVEEAIYLSKFSEHITLLVREDDFTCARSVSDKLKLYPGIKVLFGTELIKVSGTDLIDSVTLRNRKSGKLEKITAKDLPFGIFVFVGYEPNSAWLPKELKRDEQGYLMTSDKCQTNIKGVSAAGDIRQKSVRQMVTAAADGAVAAVTLEAYIQDMHKRLEIPSLWEEENPNLENMKEKAVVMVWIDDSPLSREILLFLQQEESLKNKIKLEIHNEGRKDLMLPSIEICRPDGRSAGMHFHAVPKGLEWNSFELALFNVAGSGQKIEERILQKIKKIDREVHLMVLATLSCGNCPASVMAAMQIAALNDYVTAEMFDIMQFRKLRFKYQLTSVPVLVINDQKLIVGKLDVEEMVDEILKMI